MADAGARGPDFFLLGAPKCGTSSLAAWLADNPAIYMAPVKEPHHFNTDMTPWTPDRGAYLKLFAGATAAHQAVGEASSNYLVSHHAVANILALRPDARFIVCLRDPTAMAVSLFAESRYNLLEDAASFDAAWQRERRKGEQPGDDRRQTAYPVFCCLGAHMARLYGQVPAARVLPILLEDMQSDPGAVYRQCLAFLDAGHDGRRSFPVRNAAKRVRFARLRRLELLAGRLKRRLGIHRRFGSLALLRRLNLARAGRPEISPDVAADMAAWFRPDIDRLAALIDRDLSHWARPPAPRGGA